MRSAMSQLDLSAWVYHRILKLARTITDWAESESMQAAYLAEEVSQYRPKWLVG